MNRLKGLACYLSGSIDFSPNKGCRWRNKITPFLEDINVRVFNPLKHSFYGTAKVETTKRPLMEKLLEEGKFKELREEIQELSHWDLRAVDLSSFLIVNYDINIFTCGTHDEIFLANRENKPVLLMIGKNNRKKMPKWIYGRFPPEHLFESFESLKKYLVAINSSPKYKFTEADNKRWLFFDGKHMYDK